MTHFRSLAVAVILAASAPLVGCGPKKPPTEEDGVVNPRQAFLDGVNLLKTPGKDGAIDYPAAYTKFVSAADAKADYAKAHFNAAWTSERMGKMDQAAKHYRQALDIDAGYSQALFSLGSVLSRNGQSVEAVELYKGAVAKNPGDMRVRNAYMEALTAANMYDEAIAEAKHILLQDSKNVGAYRNLSRLYFAKGDYGMSQLCAEKAKTLAEGDSGIYNNIGVTYLVMNDEPAAIAEFETARKLNPKSLEANLNLGYIALNSGDYGLARICFDAALEGEPGSVPAKMGLAVALRGTKDLAGASKLYDEILDAEKNNEVAYFNAATLYAKYMKDYKKALKTLETYVAENNDQGQIGPAHEVYARMEQVKEYQRIAEEMKKEEERKLKEAEERKKRQQEKFNELKAKVAGLKGLLDEYGDCPMMVEMGGTEMGLMVLEQAQMVVEAEEIDMAADVMTFIDEVSPQIELLIPECQGGGAAPAPEGGEAPPAEGGEAPPAEGGEAPPAEGGE